MSFLYFFSIKYFNTKILWFLKLSWWYFFADVIKSWKTADCQLGSHCLIVTDCVATDMRISCADCLIHFDIPLKSRLQFGNRFGVIAEYFTKKVIKWFFLCVPHIFFFVYFVYENPITYLPSLPYFNGDSLILSQSPFSPYFHTFLPYF